LTLLLFLAALLASMNSLDRSWSPSEQGWKRGDGLESPLSFPRAFFLFLYFSPRPSSILSFLTERTIFLFCPILAGGGKKEREKRIDASSVKGAKPPRRRLLQCLLWGAIEREPRVFKQHFCLAGKAVPSPIVCSPRPILAPPIDGVHLVLQCAAAFALLLST
jgi:hypothetical protein